MNKLAVPALLLVCLVSYAEQVKLDDKTTWEVYIEKPASVKKNTPLCLLLPPGPGTKGMAEHTLRTLGRPLAKKGWYVAIPVSPDGKPFFTRTAQLKKLIDLLRKRKNIFKGRMLIGGISNGGICSIQMAGLSPST